MGAALTRIETGASYDPRVTSGVRKPIFLDAHRVKWQNSPTGKLCEEYENFLQSAENLLRIYATVYHIEENIDDGGIKYRASVDISLPISSYNAATQLESTTLQPSTGRLDTYPGDDSCQSVHYCRRPIHSGPAPYTITREISIV
ncbi:hypothetical protein PM082_009232 [Marasmius tenuissimus]|nr:hypothetical protein PM082_009232 [Marasmius tenuissimus]